MPLVLATTANVAQHQHLRPLSYGLLFSGFWYARHAYEDTTAPAKCPGGIQCESTENQRHALSDIGRPTALTTFFGRSIRFLVFEGVSALELGGGGWLVTRLTVEVPWHQDPVVSVRY